MVRRELAVAAVVLVFGGTAAYESAKLQFGTIHSPGPGFFPWWISILIVLLALVLLAQVLTSRSPTDREAFGRIAKVVALFIVLTAYTTLLNALGYPLCTFFLVLFMLRVTDPQPWAIAVGVAAVTSISSYIVFASWLSVPLPLGSLLG